MTSSTPHRWLVVAGRALAGLALIAVSTYYLLASIPFAYYHFLQFAHFSWLPLFIRAHALVMAAGVVVLVATLPDLERRWRLRLAAAGLLFSGWMVLTTWMPASLTYESAIVLAVAPLVLLAVASVADLAAARGRQPGAVVEVERAGPSAGPALQAALLASAVYLTVSLSALRASAERPAVSEFAIATLISLAGHAAFFVVPGVAIALTARLTEHRSRIMRWVTPSALVAAAVAVLVNQIALSTLLMSRRYALAFATVIGLTLVSFWLALLARARPETSASRHPVWLPIQPHAYGQWIAAALNACAFAAYVFVLPRMLLLADWGMALQKSLVIGAWVSAALLVRALPNRLRTRMVTASLVAIVGVAGITTATMAAGTKVLAGSSPGRVGFEVLIERHAAVDPSLATIMDFVRPTLSNRDFFDKVHAAGDRTDQRGLRPVPLPIGPALAVTAAYRPHIFVIVVDSLRRDYLSPYNPAVTFTPAIAAFARDSVVMRHAYTPYAGTALSQPAIWAGGLIPRLNYPQPFSVLNNLERLVDASGYRKYVSMDEISHLTLANQASIHNLEPALEHPERQEEMFKFDLCSTTEELARQLDRDGADGRPIFMYTQPQSLHIRVLAGGFPRFEGVRIGDAEFFKPAVTALGRVDGCFGRFIDNLKQRHIYDDALIVFTADHGDAYGQQGRWGHAFYLMPETLRVPLIVHLPERLRADRTWNTETVTLTTDITPTIYDLLEAGYQPSSPLVGRSLVARASDAASRRTSPILVQSSYSRAFGLLDAKGGWLYVVNANQITESYFELDGERATEVALDAIVRNRLRAQLLEELQGFNAFYVGR